jgi:hypothetical protein
MYRSIIYLSLVKVGLCFCRKEKQDIVTSFKEQITVLRLSIFKKITLMPELCQEHLPVKLFAEQFRASGQ